MTLSTCKMEEVYNEPIWVLLAGNLWHRWQWSRSLFIYSPLLVIVYAVKIYYKFWYFVKFPYNSKTTLNKRYIYNFISLRNLQVIYNSKQCIIYVQIVNPISFLPYTCRESDAMPVQRLFVPGRQNPTRGAGNLNTKTHDYSSAHYPIYLFITTLPTMDRESLIFTGSSGNVIKSVWVCKPV